MGSYDAPKINFSVLIPVYNVEKYICECIDSVLAQTYPAYEIILVDDGSQDNSGRICDEYASQYPFIKVFHKSNGGLLSARQYAIAMATGDFYIFLDSDDSIKPEALEVVFLTHQKYNCDCVIYDFQQHINGVPVESHFNLEQPARVITDKRELYRIVFLNERFNSLCRKAVKASVFSHRDYEGFFHVSLGEDLLQTIEILENSEKVAIIPQPLYNYRIHGNSMTHTINYKNYRVDFTVAESVLSFVEKAAVFTNDDMDELRDHRIVRLVDTIRNIALFDATFQQKKAMFNEIADSIYFKSFLSKGIADAKRVGMKRYYFKLFCIKKYRLIIWCEKLYCFFSARRYKASQ